MTTAKEKLKSFIWGKEGFIPEGMYYDEETNTVHEITGGLDYCWPATCKDNTDEMQSYKLIKTLKNKKGLMTFMVKSSEEANQIIDTARELGEEGDTP